MLDDGRTFARLRHTLFGLSAVAWALLMLEPGAQAYCATGDSPPSWNLLAALYPWRMLARGWGLMLVAMMAPLILPQLYRIFLGSFIGQRTRLIACFVAGYGASWTAAGIVLLAVTLTAMKSAPDSWFPAVAAGVIAVVWQVSPFKQICLNRCHRHRPFAAFGFASDRDLLRQGLEHGLWCVGSCWALMLVPLLVPDQHFVGMTLAAAIMYCERLDRPASPSWQWRGLGTAWGQARLRFRTSGL